MVVDCYANADFWGLCGHGNLQDYICAGSRTGFVAIFSSFPLLWVSKLHTDIYLSNIHSKYVALSHSVRDLLPLEILIK